MSGWEILDLTGVDGKIEVKSHQLRVVRKGDSSPPSPKGLENIAVMLVGENVEISPGVLHSAAEHGISVVFCDWKLFPVSVVSPWSDHSRVGARQIAQHTASLPQRKQVWKLIVESKIKGQSRVLRMSGDPGWERLLDIADGVKSGDSGNAESVAAAFYWKRVFGRGFVRDRTLGDSLNCALNYGYMVLRARATHAVVAAGLHPGLGVFHRGHSNPFALADDLIEPFRPSVDAAIVLMGTVDMNSAADKKSLVAASTSLMGGGQKSVTSEMVSLARSVGMYFEDKSVKITVPVWMS